MFYKQLFIALTALFSAANPFYAQQTGTLKSPELAKFTFSEELSDFPERMFKDANGGLYTIKTRKNEEYLTKYDGTLKQVFEKPFVTPKSDRDLEIMDIVLWNDKPTIFYRGTRKKQVGQIFYAKLEEDGTLGKLEQLSRFTESEEYLFCYLTYSPDRSKLLIYAELSCEEDDLMTYSIYDKDLKELWKTKSKCKIFDMRQKALKVVRTITPSPKCMIDNAGRFLAYFPVKRDPKKTTDDDGDYFYQVYQFKQDTPKPKIYTVDYKSKVLYNFDFMPSKNPNEFIGYGTYTGSTKLSAFSGDAGVMGTYRFILNVANNELKKEPVQPFPDAVFELMNIKDKKKEAGDGIKNIRVHRVDLMDNNNLVIVLENNYQVYHGQSQLQSNPNRNAAGTMSYHSDMAIVVKYDANGKVLYQKYIPKRSLHSSASHIFYLSKKNREILIFNDDSRNRDRDIKDMSEVFESDWTSKYNQTYAISPNNDGDYEASIFMQYTKDNPFVLRANGTMVQYTPQSIIALVMSSKKSLCKLVRIDY